MYAIMLLHIFVIKKVSVGFLFAPKEPPNQLFLKDGIVISKCPHGQWTCYYIRCSQRHLLAAFENKRLVSPIGPTSPHLPS